MIQIASLIKEQFLTILDLMQLGVLLIHLSGVDRCCLPKAMERSTTVTSNFSRYVETAKYRVLNPLRLNPKFSDLGPLILVTVKLLETGCISSLRDLEAYMIGISMVRSPKSSLQVIC